MVGANKRQFRASRIMPELPEVETVRRGLAPVLIDQRIERVIANRPDLRFPLPERFNEQVAGQTVVKLERRAKYLIAVLDGGNALVMHLGMTGRFAIDKNSGRTALGEYVYANGAHARHDHVEFHTSGGARVIYNDARRFGFMLLMAEDTRAEHPLFRNLGAEPLSEDLTAAYLAAKADGKKVNLKAFLMDQRTIAGLGNIYVSESLFRAGLSPERAAHTLSGSRGKAPDRSQHLVSAIKGVLADAISAGGSTLKDYRQADGASGAFQENFKAYDRAGAPCVREGCGGRILRAVHGSRATFYCSKCQR
jgi:formamidopyrimidine-DNA glycosylase